jgi:hypothetical protein
MDASDVGSKLGGVLGWASEPRQVGRTPRPTAPTIGSTEREGNPRRVLARNVIKVSRIPITWMGLTAGT